MNAKRIDWPSFWTCVALILAISVPLALNPDAGGTALKAIYRWISEGFGIVYLVASVACISFLVWLALGRFAHVRLSSHGEAPEFSTISWIAMLFCAGIGAGLIYWCVIEWTYYYSAPPFGAAPRSTEAAEWASTYGLFHWGVTAWAFYCLPTLAIAYPYYRKQIPWLRFSNGCHRYLQGNQLGPVGRFVDFWLAIAIIAGAGSSLAFSTPMIAASISHLAGIDYVFGMNLVVIGLSLAIFATSVWLGLKKGMKNLSDLTLILSLLVLAYVLLAGPTEFLLRTSVNGMGLMLQNFLRMNFWTDPYERTGFVEDWTIFYWAWWISYAPFVGLFITRISRGRSIRELIVGMLVFGSLGCWAFYMVIGNYSMHLELSGQLAVSQIVQSQGGHIAIVEVLKQLPLAWVLIAVFTLMSIAFAATTYDAAAQALAASQTLYLPEGEDPPRWLRVFWALAIGVLPATLMYVGGIEVVKTGILVASLPILAICVVCAVAFVKDLHDDHPRPAPAVAQPSA
jgi:BCCT family betaine/carnitine transporter